MRLLIDNCNIELVFDKESGSEAKRIKSNIHHTLDPYDPKRFRDRRFRSHIWDGRIKLCDLDNNLVPTGLYSDLVALLDNNNLTVISEDLRGKPLVPKGKIPKEITLKQMEGEPKVKELTLRDHQRESVNLVLKNQRGLVDSSTASGKSSIAYALCKYLIPSLQEDERLLIIAPNAGIMNQLYNNFRGYLGSNNIGIWGDHKKEIDGFPVVCATIQTLNSAIKVPKVNISSDKDKRLVRFATKYYDIVMHSDNALTNLKMLYHNFTIKYKYEEEDKEVFWSLLDQISSDKEVIKTFKAYKRKYNKLLLKKNKKGYDKYNEAVLFLDGVRGVICDECHMSAAPGYRNVFELLPNARLRMGMSGSLDTNNEERFLKIKSILGDSLIEITNSQMEEAGYSAHLHVKLINITEPDDLEKQVSQSAKVKSAKPYIKDLVHYQELYRLGVIENDHRNKLIATLASRLAERDDGMGTLIIVSSIEHGEFIEKWLQKLDVKYAFIQGLNSSEDRQEVLDGVRNGTIPVVLSTKIMDAGIDVPNLKYLILVDAGKSYVATVQRAGRVLRVLPDKKDSYLFDLVDRTAPKLYEHAKQRISIYKKNGFHIEGRKK